MNEPSVPLADRSTTSCENEDVVAEATLARQSGGSGEGGLWGLPAGFASLRLLVERCPFGQSLCFHSRVCKMG